MLCHMRGGRGKLSRWRAKHALMFAARQGVLFTLFMFAWVGITWRVLLGGMFFMAFAAASSLWQFRKTQPGLEALSDAELMAVVSAFRRGTPVTPELAP